jgi:hypothetical protein
MSNKMNRQTIPFISTLLASAIVTTQSALAANVTYFPQMITAIAYVTTFISAAGYFAGVILIGMTAWEFMGHRRIGNLISELVGAVFAVVVAVNGPALAAALGLTAASIK